MTIIDNLNTCVSSNPDYLDQTNCVRAALGYAPVTATSSTVTTTSLAEYALIGGAIAFIIFLFAKK